MGFRPITPDEIADTSAPSIPSFFEHPIDAISSPAWWLTKPSGQPVDFNSGILGDVTSIPSTVGKMFSDIPSGISNLAHLPGDLYGAVVNDPNTDLDRLIRTTKGGGNLLASILGFGYGGPAGAAGATEGLHLAQEGVDKLFGGTSEPITSIPEDLNSLRRNTVQGAILAKAADISALPLGKISEVTEPLPAVDRALEMAQSLKPDLGPISKLNNRQATIDGVTPALQSFEVAKQKGIFEGDPEPQAIKARNEAAITGIENEIHGEEGLLKQADETIATKKIPADAPKESLGWWESLDNYVNKRNAALAGDKPLPDAPIEYPAAEKYIARFPRQEPELRQQLEETKTSLSKNFDGTLTSLSRFKSSLGKDAFAGTGKTFSQGLDTAIYSDLKSTIEQRANDAIPGLGDQIGSLNGELSKLYPWRTIINKAVDRSDKATFTPNKTEIPPGFIKSGLKGAILGKGLGILGQVAHLGNLSPELVALGTALGLGRAAIKNPTIAAGVSGVSGGLASAISGATGPGAIAANQVTKSALGVEPKQYRKFVPLASAKSISTEEFLKQEDPKIQTVALIESQKGKYNLSAKGARGPMQIMPATGKFIADKLGVKNYTPAMLDDPTTNIKFGKWYLTYLENKYKRLDYALAAYNMGPGAFDDYLSGKRTMPQETKEYLVKFNNLYSQLTRGA